MKRIFLFSLIALLSSCASADAGPIRARLAARQNAAASGSACTIGNVMKAVNTAAACGASAAAGRVRGKIVTRFAGRRGGC